MTAFRKLFAFIRRDFIIETSYKIAFLQRLMYTIVPLILIFFLSKLAESSSIHLKKYGGTFFQYAVIGMCVSNFINIGLNTFKASIRRAQLTGCLEAILNSQTDTRSIILMSSAYSFISASVNLIIAAIVIRFFNFDYSNINLFATLIIIFISVLLFISLGIISAALVILYKQGDPLGFILGTFSSFLGGAFIPVTLFPEWMQKISAFIPIKYTLDAVRLTILKGYSLKMVSQEVIILSSLVLVLFPLSLAITQLAIKKGKEDGTITQY